MTIYEKPFFKHNFIDIQISTRLYKIMVTILLYILPALNIIHWKEKVSGI
jgi:hypothetical protein